jgi:hypothetical protein
MDRQALVDSIAYCGLVCGRCHLRKECDGCKNTARLCARSKVCYQRNCCIQKGLQGCWECDEFPCGKDMHGPVHDLRIRAFVAFIKTEGTETLVDCLLRNEGRGINYGQNGDYDGKTSEEEVIRLLKTGLSY